MNNWPPPRSWERSGDRRLETYPARKPYVKIRVYGSGDVTLMKGDVLTLDLSPNHYEPAARIEILEIVHDKAEQHQPHSSSRS